VSRTSVGVGAIVAGALALGGCHRRFSCDDDEQCRQGGVQGACEPNGWCSFPANGCPSGRRYGEHAAEDLVGECVEPGGDTAAGTGTSTGVGTGTTSDDGTSGGDGSTTQVGTTGDDDPCNGLTPSGPIVATENGQVIAGLRIVAPSGPAVAVEGVTGVTIRDCEIHHAAGPGIRFSAADGIRIENVAVVHDAAPAEGSHDAYQASIEGRYSEDVRIERVRMRDGSSGIDLEGTPAAMVSFVESYDVRGPMPAACVRLALSDGAVLSDFYCENDLVVARPFNVVEIQHSNDVTVQRGLLDGNNAEFGYGVHFTQVSGQHSGGLVEDVDTIRQTNGGFSCFSFGEDITFSRTRARENICEILSIPIEGCMIVGPNGGCVPNSTGITWTADGGASNIVILDSVYTELCGDTVWPDPHAKKGDIDAFIIAEGDLIEADFELRAPPGLEFCWE
jgi:hypothetical protein